MHKSLPVHLAGILLLVATIACAGSAVPTTSPDAISTIVAATFNAITPAPTNTSIPPTAAIPTLLMPTASVPTLAPGGSGVNVPTATRINFLASATEGVVTAPIGPGQVQNYVLQAAQGQPMMVTLTSPNQDVTLSIKTQGGTSILSASSGQANWQGSLPQTEDYYLGVHGGATTENFTLNIVIPSRIKIPEGAVSTKVSGKTVGGYDVTYTAFAVKGQKMTVKLDYYSDDAVLAIYGFTDGQPYLRYVTEQKEFSFKLPATQDYIIQVVPRAGSVVNFTMEIEIQ